MVSRIVLAVLLGITACSSPAGPGEGLPPQPPVAFRVDYSEGCLYIPIWVAYREGMSPWSLAHPVATGVWEFSVTADRHVTTAMVFERVGGSTLGLVTHEFDASSSTIADGLQAECYRTRPTTTVTVRASGLEWWEQAGFESGWGGRGAVVTGGGTAELTIPTSGTPVVLAAKLPVTRDELPTRFVFIRDLTGMELSADFGGAMSFTPLSATLRSPALSDDWPTEVRSGYLSAECRDLLSGYYRTILNNGAAIIQGMPSMHQEVGELHKFVAQFNDLSSSTMLVEVQRRTFGPVSLTPPPMIDRPELTSLPGPYDRFRTTMAVPQEFNAFLRLRVSAGNGRLFTTAYVDGSLLSRDPTTVEIPDLSSAPGWKPEYAPGNGLAEYWDVTVLGSTGGHVWQREPCVDGMVSVTAARYGYR